MDSIKGIYAVLGPHVPESWIKMELVNAKHDGILAPSGEREISGIASRMAKRHGEFIGHLVEKRQNGLRLFSSEWQRSQESARVFREVVDPDNRTPPVVVVPAINDTTMAIRFACPRWNQAREQGAQDIARETEAFDAIHGQRIQMQVSHRLALVAKRAISLSLEEISNIYTLCGYDMSLFDEAGHWCSLLDTHTLSLLELRSDIKYSRVYGPYGPSLNRRMACALFTQIGREIERALADPENAVSTFRFAHAETVMFISTLLELESALGNGRLAIAGNMTQEQAQARGFKTSRLAPFSANIGIEIYRDQDSQAVFSLLLNEAPVLLPGCKDALCPVDVLRSNLAGKIGCDFEKECAADSKA
ncbi:hypothetical protein LPJ56_006557 [Coemansia sp. RSA 2599]|nr:hypothetical protein LPJ56_006557 [Coemansia sp. RSA 2599]